MLKVLFLLECDACKRTHPYVHVSPNPIPKELEELAAEFPKFAQRFSRWCKQDQYYSCPECFVPDDDDLPF